MKTKTCSKCKEEKPANKEAFTTTGDKLASWCRECSRQKARAYRKANRELVRERDKKFYQKNRDRLRAYTKQHQSSPEYKEKKRLYDIEYKRKYRSNPEKIELENRYVREKIKSDPVFRIQRNVSKAVWQALKMNGSGKSHPTWKALPYTPQELKEHIEKQFEPWMTWENHGEWHIDHIYPQSKLPYDSLVHPNFQKCWALENLQPLCAIKNIKKSDKVLDI
jgi:hypothetical protein